MLRPTVNTEYPDDVEWITFEDFENWWHFEGYAYNISHDRIEAALCLLEQPNIFKLVESEMSGDWQDANVLTESSLIPEDLKHPIRIAYLVKMIPINGISPVWIDTMSYSPSKLEGHHRLLALKFLKYQLFPVMLSGFVDEFPPTQPIEMPLLQ